VKQGIPIATFLRKLPGRFRQNLLDGILKGVEEGQMAVGKSPHRPACIILICWTLTFSCRPQGFDEKADLPPLPFAGSLQRAIDRVLADNPVDHPLGLSAAVLMPDYRVWAGVSGTSHVGVPIAEDMLFDAGSVEKNFEAALALRLAEEGVLSLDAPIATYLPDLRNVDGGVTVRQLLDHTSGIYNVFEHPDFPWAKSGIDFARSWRLEEVFDRFVLEPYGPPGYAQHYSSTNYLLLTVILEDLMRSSVPEQIDRHFLRPMNLEHTFVSMGDPPPDRFDVAHPWVELNQDSVLEDLSGIPLTWKVTLTHPALFSTATDLARWTHALYHEQTVLDPGSLAEMLTFPEAAQKDPTGNFYGLGVVDFTETLGVRVIGHGGSALGYSAAALYLPDWGVSLAWLVNAGESPMVLADRLMLDTWTSLYEVLSAHQNQAGGTPAPQLQVIGPEMTVRK
jgi:D-alanyl-D-alanine carboxypeptidase